MKTKGHRKIRKVDIKDDHVPNKVWGSIGAVHL